MKFIRFGSLSPQWQRQYVAEPTADTSPHKPPRRNGIYAFPLGYFDPWYLFTPNDRPASSRWAITEYLRLQNGEKITRREWEKGDGVFIPKNKKTFKEKNIVWEPRPSYIMVMKDADNPPKYIDDDENKGLDQPLDFLLDDDGNKIWSKDFLLEAYDNSIYHDDGFIYITEDEVQYDWKTVYAKNVPAPFQKWLARLPGTTKTDEGFLPLKHWLAMKGIAWSQLCPWPVYPRDEDCYATVYKKSRMFEYDGCLWHHLGGYLKHNEILAGYNFDSTEGLYTWVYTDIKTFEKALRKSDPKRFWQNKQYSSKDNDYSKGGRYTMNATLVLSGMYEVFIDQKV